MVDGRMEGVFKIIGNSFTSRCIVEGGSGDS